MNYETKTKKKKADLMNKDICVHKNTQLDMLKTAADPHMPQPFAELWFCLFFLLFD